MSKEEINAFLGAGTVYNGRLAFQGAVRIDGEFTGEVLSEGALIVGKDAIIEGTLDVGELILAGVFRGDVHAKKRVTIHKTGTLEGTIQTPALIVEEGAVIDGQTSMSKTDAPKRQQSTAQDPFADDLSEER